MAGWWGHEVAAGFRFSEPSDIAGAIEVAGFFAGVRLERTSYPEEIETRRASPLARRLTGNNHRMEGSNQPPRAARPPG